MGNVIEIVRSTGSNYWAAYVGGEKIKTNRLKRHTRTNAKVLWNIFHLLFVNGDNHGTKVGH